MIVCCELCDVCPLPGTWASLDCCFIGSGTTAECPSGETVTVDGLSVHEGHRSGDIVFMIETQLMLHCGDMVIWGIQ